MASTSQRRGRWQMVAAAVDDWRVRCVQSSVRPSVGHVAILSRRLLRRATPNYAVYLFHLDGRSVGRPARITDGY